MDRKIYVGDQETYILTESFMLGTTLANKIDQFWTKWVAFS